jgi:hypothetical protein
MPGTIQQMKGPGMILFSRIPGARFWTAVTVVLCGLVLVNNTVYFDGGQTPKFLLEKGALAHHPLWRAAFYFHVLAASICLAAGLPLMFPGWTRRHPAWHRRLGYAYVNAVLWAAAPAGLVMSPVAKGGVWGAAGFSLAAGLWWWVTWSGYRAILRGDLTAHVRGMVRSYSLALSAPMFRVFQILVYGMGLDDGVNYVVSLWLSIAASVLLAEFSLGRRRAPLLDSPAPATWNAGEII